ncbi:hypothetical protein DP107_09320 [Haloglomus irregulare]|jgi:hypothetical protein|uniref:Lipoprotein n=1 Tax=Haloglomus irregulare TaxID=2234134 RepID=A0A554NAP5_9EURY|nr:hypothetical protein [Haloglomus irregulare]TSD14425.1 hypothetical protein DP107_09320 [Haloglomus irregulare]
MQRRALLRAAALAGVAGLAGCTTDGGGSGGTTDPTGSPTDTPTDRHTPTPADEPNEGTPTRTPRGNGLIGSAFEVVDRGCGTGRNTVDITFDGEFVRVGGVIGGDNACYTAEQERAEFDYREERLRVAVRSYRRGDADACADCLVDIKYAAEYAFEGRTPDEVVVAHDGEAVVTATRASTRSTERTTTG